MYTFYDSVKHCRCNLRHVIVIILVGYITLSIMTVTRFFDLTNYLSLVIVDHRRAPDMQTVPTTSEPPRVRPVRCRRLRGITAPIDGDIQEEQRPGSVGCADDVDMLDAVETCLGVRPHPVSNDFIDRSLSTNGCFLVPNVVHYTFIRPADKLSNVPVPLQPFTFLQYLSFVSADKHIRPRHIFVHGDSLPDGDWWGRLVNEVPNIYHVNWTEPPSHVFGKQLQRAEHRTDLLRYKLMYEFGGIYLDPDMLVFRSFDPLRNYSLTLGSELVDPLYLAIGVIISRPGALILRLWFETYRTYSETEWSFHSVIVPGRLKELYPDMIHVEHATLISPTWTELDHLFGTQYHNWTGQYSCHVWRGYGKVPSSPAEIVRLNSTLGQMMRFIYYGQTQFVVDQSVNQSVVY